MRVEGAIWGRGREALEPSLTQAPPPHRRNGCPSVCVSVSLTFQPSANDSLSPSAHLSFSERQDSTF